MTGRRKGRPSRPRTKSGTRLRRLGWALVLLGVMIAAYATYKKANRVVNVSATDAAFEAVEAPVDEVVVPREEGEIEERPLMDLEAERARAARLFPRPPENFRTEEVDGVRWVYPVRMAAYAEDLQEVYRDKWPELVAEFGREVDGSMEVRLTRNPDEMRELAPALAPPPAYATGVAYTTLGVIVLSAVAPESWEVPDLETVFVHELSHIALRRAVSGHPLPRWFVEGVAIEQANESSFERLKTLWRGESGGTLVPLDQLAANFPARPYEANLAYAQAADVVAFLRSGEGDARRFAALIDELEEGDGFASALRDAYALTPGQLERDWRDALHERVSSLPLLVGSSSVWALAAILLIMAYRRRRQDHHRRLAEMGAQEAADDAAIARIEAMTVEVPDDTWNVVFDRLNPRSQDVPTVRHDGEDHTLH